MFFSSYFCCVESTTLVTASARYYGSRSLLARATTPWEFLSFVLRSAASNLRMCVWIRWVTCVFVVLGATYGSLFCLFLSFEMTLRIAEQIRHKETCQSPASCGHTARQIFGKALEWSKCFAWAFGFRRNGFVFMKKQRLGTHLPLIYPAHYIDTCSFLP